MKTKSSTAQVAATIKNLLKTNFPTIKFSVKSSIFAGGDSVDIYWNFGPKEDEVKTIVSRFQGGSFNSYEDIYEYHQPTIEINADGYLQEQLTVKYVSCNRSYKSKADVDFNSIRIENAAYMLCEQFNLPKSISTNLFNSNDYRDHAYNVAARMIRKMSFKSNDIEITAAIRTDRSCGQAEDFYTFEYKELEDTKKVSSKPRSVKPFEKVKTPEKKTNFLKSVILKVLSIF